MNIRPFEQTDAVAVSELIRNTIRISNVKDYPIELMERLIESQTPQHVIERQAGRIFMWFSNRKRLSAAELSDHIGAKRTRAAYLLFSYCLNIREKV